MKKYLICFISIFMFLFTVSANAINPLMLDPDTPGVYEPIHSTDKFKLQQYNWQCGPYMVHNMIYYNTHTEISVSTLITQLHTSSTGSGTDANNVAGVLNLYNSGYVKRSCSSGLSAFKGYVKNTLNANRSVGFNIDMYDLYGSSYSNGTGHYLMAYKYSGNVLYCYDSYNRGFLSITFDDMFNATFGMYGFYYTK